MSNQVHHNKWHGFNHHTVSTPGFPDSSTDPIASREYPFRGVFYTIQDLEGFTINRATMTSTGSGYTVTPKLVLSARNTRSKVIRPGNFKANINTALKTITSVEIVDGGTFTGSVNLVPVPDPGDTIVRTAIIFLSSIPYTISTSSMEWWFYSNLTITYSSDWNLWNDVKTTTINNSSFWDLGYEGYTNLIANSSNFSSVYSSTLNLSGEDKYTGLSGVGWHIALSSITHKLNTSAIDIRQKVAVPVRLIDRDYTLSWNTTAQTVYYSVTGNYPVTASDIFEAKKGGKYTMWLYIDRCPQEFSNVIFDKDRYTIAVKKDGTVYQSHDNVLTLSGRHLTRIDFVYDGVKMLGRATNYFIDLPTTLDTYYKGTGIVFYDSRLRKRNPVQVNGAIEPFNHIGQYTGTKIDLLNLSQFTATSSYYIPGTGIKMRFLGADSQYFSINLFNAQWPSSLAITKIPALTSSFDKVIGLSGGSWLLPEYGYNLVASPVSADAPIEIIQKFPEPKYGLGSSNIVTLKQCTSTYTLEIYSGKDRIIDNLTINGFSVVKQPVKQNGYNLPFTTLNEETASITYVRVQEDQDIEIYFNTQPAVSIPNNILWFNSMDDTLFKPNTLNVDQWYNNSNEPYSLIQTNINDRPLLDTIGVLRGVYLKNNDFLTLNTPLTALSASDSTLLNIPFATVSVVEFDSFPSTSFLWWLGSFNYNGYGLMMRGNKLYTRPGTTPSEEVDGTTFQTGRKYVITTVYDGTYERILIDNRTVSQKSRRKIFKKPGNLTLSTPSDLALTFGKNPSGNNGYSDYKLYEFVLFKKALTVPEINKINLFYINKIRGYT
jgi:hypothetical protein